MQLAPNKICVTQKGLELINDEKQQQNQQNSNENGPSLHCSQAMSRTCSLPLLKSRSLISQPKLAKKLCILSRTKLKLQKIGLKSMGEKRTDELIKKKLNDQFVQSSRYVKSIIPHLVKMTKDKSQNNELESRFQKARMYVARLQQNFNTKFVFKAKRSEQKDF